MPKLVKIASRDVTHAIAQKKLDEVIVNEIIKKFPKLTAYPFAIDIGKYDEKTQNLVGQVNVRVSKDNFIVIPILIEDGILYSIDTFIYNKHVLPLEPWIVDLVVKKPDIVRLLYPVEEQMLKFPFTYKYAERPNTFKLFFKSFEEPIVRKYFDLDNMRFKTEPASIYEYDLSDKHKSQLVKQGSILIRTKSPSYKIYKIAQYDEISEEIRNLDVTTQRKTEPIPDKSYQEAIKEEPLPDISLTTCSAPVSGRMLLFKVFKLFNIIDNELVQNAFLLVNPKYFAISPDLKYCNKTEEYLDISPALRAPDKVIPGEKYFCVDPQNNVAFGPIVLNKIISEPDRVEAEGIYYDSPIKVIKNPKVKMPILLPEGVLMSELVFVSADPTKEVVIGLAQNQNDIIKTEYIPKQADYRLKFDKFYQIEDLRTGKSFRFTSLDKDLVFATLGLTEEDDEFLKSGKPIYLKRASSPKQAMAAKAALAHYAKYGPDNVGRSLVNTIADPNNVKVVTEVVAAVVPVWDEFVKEASDVKPVDKDPSTTINSVLSLNVVTDENINALLESASSLLRVLEYLTILRLVVRLGWKGVVPEQRLTTAIQALSSIIKNILAYKKQLV